MQKLMHRIPFCLAIVSFLYACNHNKIKPSPETTVVDSAAVVNDPKNNLNIQTSTFLEIDSSGILMFPISMGESERNDDGTSYYKSTSSSFWNVIFLNSKTSTYHYLSDRKMLIINYNLEYSKNASWGLSPIGKYIFYEITVDDYNKDQLLNLDDPKYLFVTDCEGKNFRQISPSNYYLGDWQFVKSINKVIMTARIDSDKNNKFDKKDEEKTFEVDMASGTEAKEVFSTDFKNKLKILYDRDWKRVKK